VDITGVLTDGVIPDGIEISPECVECVGGPPPPAENNKYTACEGQECEFTEFITDAGNPLIDSGLFNFNCCWYYVDELTPDLPTEYSPQEDWIFPMDLDCEEAVNEFTTFEINPCEGTEGVTMYVNCFDGIRPSMVIKIKEDEEEGCYYIVGPSNETEPMANYVSTDYDGCESPECPEPEINTTLTFQPGEEEGMVEVYYTSDVEISGFDIQFRPGFNVIDATGEGGAAGNAEFDVVYSSEVPSYDGDTSTSKVGMWSYVGATLEITDADPVLLCLINIEESNEGLFDDPLSTARWTTMENNIGADGTINDYLPDGILDILDIIRIWNEAMINYFGVTEVGSQFEDQGSDYETFLVSGPLTGGLELLVGTANCILDIGDPEPVCNQGKEPQSNYVTFVDIGDGDTSAWPTK
jgi:hypothetical protein